VDRDRAGTRFFVGDMARVQHAGFKAKGSFRLGSHA
jgi:hypothetical protein